MLVKQIKAAVFSKIRMKLLIFALVLASAAAGSSEDEGEKSMIGVASDEESKQTVARWTIDATPVDDASNDVDELEMQVRKAIGDMMDSAALSSSSSLQDDVRELSEEDISERNLSEEDASSMSSSLSSSVQEREMTGDSTYNLLKRYLQSALALEKRAKCGVKSTLSRKQKRRALAFHNYYRAREPASDMAKLRWDNSLAIRAQEWANQCKWKHGMLSDCNGRTAGQNLYMVSKGSSYAKIDMKTPIQNWYSEKPNYHYETRKCQVGKMCGHYKQLVRSSTSHVGCGIANCPVVKEGVTGSPWKMAVIVACNYRIVIGDGSENIYRKGKACSNCGSIVKVGYKCQKNMCVECNPVKDSKCICVKRACENGGSWNAKACKCKCDSEHYGPVCQYNCKCQDVLHECASWKSFCSQPAYKTLMQDNCPITCSMCRKPPAGACK